MIHRMIQDRLDKDAGSTFEERRKLFREIVQELAIYSLSAGAFLRRPFSMAVLNCVWFTPSPVSQKTWISS